MNAFQVSSKHTGSMPISFGASAGAAQEWARHRVQAEVLSTTSNQKAMRTHIS